MADRMMKRAVFVPVVALLAASVLAGCSDSGLYFPECDLAMPRGLLPPDLSGACKSLSFAPPMSYPVGRSPGGIAVGDLNGDGKLDLATANGGGNKVSVLLNRGPGTFDQDVEYPAGPVPVAVAIADIDGDGSQDLAVVGQDEQRQARGQGTLLFNQGTGTFNGVVQVPLGNEPVHVALFDLNGDCRPDLVVPEFQDNTVSILLNEGDRTFASKVDYATGQYPKAIATGDLNDDGVPDVAVANGINSTVSVLLGLGAGRFTAAANYATGAGVGSQPWGVAASDLNGDGLLDLVTANNVENATALLFNQGKGAFAPPQSEPTGEDPETVAVGDFDGDGQPDLVTPNYYGGTVSVLLNRGGGVFAGKMDVAITPHPIALVLGDLNADGRLDIAVTDNSKDVVAVLLNTCQ